MESSTVAIAYTFNCTLVHTVHLQICTHMHMHTVHMKDTCVYTGTCIPTRIPQQPSFWYLEITAVQHQDSLNIFV